MLDYGILVIIALFAVLGAVSGLLAQVLRLVASIVSVMLAIHLSGPAMKALGWFKDVDGMREFIYPIIIFILSYMVLGLIAKGIVYLFRKSSDTLSVLDRILGFLVGAVKGAVLAYFIVFIVLAAESATGRKVAQFDTDDSVVAEFVEDWPIGTLEDINPVKAIRDIEINLDDVPGVKGVGKIIDKIPISKDRVGKAINDVPGPKDIGKIIDGD